MAGIDAPYRDPREELARAMQRAMRPPPAAPLPTTAPIPVGEVTEFQQPKLVQTPAQQPGRSPEFREAQRGIGAMPAAPAESAAPRGAVARGAAAAGGLARGVLPAVAGVTIGALQDRSPPPVDTRVTAPTGPGQIPYVPTVEQMAAGAQPAPSGPAPVAERSPLGFGPNNEATRNIANAINAVPGGGRILNAGRLTERLVAGGNVAQQVVRGAQSTAGAGQVSTWTDAKANGSDLPAPPQGIGDFNDRRFDAARGMTPGEAGRITYDPATKTYSGTDVKEGASITGGLPGQRGTGRGNVTTLDTSEGFAQDLKQLASLRAERESGFAVNQPGAGLAGIADSGAQERPTTEARIRDLMRAGLSNRQAVQAVAQERSDATQNEAGERTAVLTARGQDIGAVGQAQAQRGQQATARMQDQTTRDIAVLNASRPSAANQQPRFTAVNLPDTVDANGQVVRGGQAVLNNQTGQWEYPNAGRQQQQFTKGQVYTDAKGNRATWDGEKFVPVK